MKRTGVVAVFTLLFILACASLPLRPIATTAQSMPAAPNVAVAPQYDSTHVYVSPGDFDRFVASFLATFGGAASKKLVVTVTPTPSSAIWQLLQTPVGTLSVFGYKTPVPYPFGRERTGYLVTNLAVALEAAQANGAHIAVGVFNDAIGKDAVIQWPGGVNMQLYWHTTPPSYKPLETIPENRVYLSAGRADAFIQSFVGFSRGRVDSDDPHAPAIEIGRNGGQYRRVRIESAFGKLTALVAGGELPYPYGRETTGYEVTNLAETLAKAKSSGAEILVPPFTSDGRTAAMVAFPGGYVAEVHAAAHPKQK